MDGGAMSVVGPSPSVEEEGPNIEPSKEEETRANKSVLYLRESLQLMAIQVVTVTYVAGLNPPGGVWTETKDGYLTGNPILHLTYRVRYNAFSYSNATALMASVTVVILLLFVKGKSSERPWFNIVLRIVMSMGTLALAVAYTAGASRDKFTTKFASVLVAFSFSSVMCFIPFWIYSSRNNSSTDDLRSLRSPRSVLGAIFVMSMTYTVGLSPPGAFWLQTQEGHRAGDPALSVHSQRRFVAFFVGNTMAFATSIFSIPLLLTDNTKGCLYCLYNNIIEASLVIAYAAGSSVNKAYIAYVLLIGATIMPTTLLMLKIRWHIWEPIKKWLQQREDDTSRRGMDPFFILLFTTLSAAVTYQAGLNPPGGLLLDDLDGHKAGNPILLAKQPMRYKVFMYCNSMALVASLVANVMALTRRCQTQISRRLDGLLVLDMISLIGAYAAGCCRDVQTSIHIISIGGAVVAYVVFHMAFLMPRDNLKDNDKALGLDRDLMLGILGATLTYQTGLTPPGGFWQRDDQFGHHAGEPVLLSTYPNRYTVFLYLNAICFMASIFLTVLFVNPLLYRVGIQCRALFICMLALLFSLIGAYAAGSYRNLGASIYIITLGVVVLIFITSILWLIYNFEVKSQLGKQGGQQDQLIVDQERDEEKKGEEEEEEEKKKKDADDDDEEETEKKKNKDADDEEEEEEEKKKKKKEEKKKKKEKKKNKDADDEEEEEEEEEKKKKKKKEEKKKKKEEKKKEKEKVLMYLVLIGSVATTVTYQAGFAPPYGFWPDDNNGHTMGNPVLRDINAYRYHIFFFFNTTAFAASATIMNGGKILDLVFDWVTRSQTIYTILQPPTMVYAIGILGAYAAGSRSGWNNTFLYVIFLIAPVMLCIFVIDHVITWVQETMAKCTKVFEE